MTTTATVTCQSEWMTYFQGRKLPPAGPLLCFDSTSGIVVFFIDVTTKKLSCSLSTNGKPSDLHDLSALWKLNGAIISVHGTQDADNNIYLGFVREQQQGEAGDSVYFTKALDPANLDTWQDALVTISSSSPKIDAPLRVQSVNLGTTFDSLGAPEASVRYLKQVGSDLAVVQYAADNKHFEYEFVSLPSVPDKGSTLVSVTGTVESLGRGTFAAYRQGGVQFLTFVPTKTRFGFIQCPQLNVQDGVNSIHILQRSDGLTDLLVGGSQGLDWYDATTMNHNSISGKRIASGSVDHIRVSYSPESHLNTACLVLDHQKLGCIRFDDKLTTASPFMTMVTGNFANIATSSNANGTISRLVYANAKSELTLLERSSLGIWNEKRLHVAPRDEVVPTTAYVSHVKLNIDDQRRVANKKFLLSCTSSVDLIVNDIPITVDASGTEVTTTNVGQLELVDTTQGISSASFTLSHIDKEADPVLPGGHLLIDPSSVVRDRLGSADAQDANKLKDLQVGSGKDKRPLFNKNTDFHALAKTITDIHGHMKTLNEDGTVQQDSSNSQSWSSFHWLQSLAKSAADFFFEAGQVVIKIGQRLWKFAINCFEQALKAVTAVLQAAGAALEDLVHWLGFIFNWEDILATQRSVSFVLTQMFSLADSAIDAGFAFIDSELLALKTSLTGISDEKDDRVDSQDNSTSNIEKTKADSKSASNSPSKPSSHPAIDYILGKIAYLFSPDSDEADFSLSHLSSTLTYWLDEINTAIKPLEKDFERIKKDVMSAVSTGGTKNIGSIMATIGKDVIALLIDALRQIIEYGILPAIKGFLKLIHDGITKPIFIPFLTPLYKSAFGKDPPSLVDIFALFIAVPTTILGKIMQTPQIPKIDQQVLDAALRPSTSPIHINNMENGDHGTIVTTMDVKDGPAADVTKEDAPLCLIGVQAFDIEESATPIDKPFIVELFCTLAKGASVAFAMPMIDRGSWDTTVVTSLRMGSWFLDMAFTTADIVTIYLARSKIGKHAKYVNELLNILGPCSYFMVQESIAIVEVRDFTSRLYPGKAGGVKALLSVTRCVELLVLLVSKLSYAAAIELEDVKAKLGAGALSTSAGLAAGGMQLVRGLSLGHVDQTETGSFN